MKCPEYPVDGSLADQIAYYYEHIWLYYTDNFFHYNDMVGIPEGAD